MERLTGLVAATFTPMHDDGSVNLAPVPTMVEGLLRNASLRFLSMDCTLRVERAGTAFTSRWQKGATFRAPMAHGDGNYFADDATLDRLEGEGLVAFRYVNEAGEATGFMAP